MSENERRVYSVIGTLPEPGGYAVAKFSRSARPYKEWIRELTQEGASRFYEHFYFAYGHASIADLAHLTMVAENISIVAAIEMLDEQLVDAQESSTRYQDFTRRRYYTPPEIAGSPFAADYVTLCDDLFATYQTTHRAVASHFEDRYADQRPSSMPDDEYRRTLRARAFDVTRYLLPASTFTGLGYLCSARTLERQISRLASHPLAEVRSIAEDLRRAAVDPAYNPRAEALEPELQAFVQAHPGPDAVALAGRSREAAMAGAAAAPTLVRHTEPADYPALTYETAREEARSALPDLAPDGHRGVQLGPPLTPPMELAATLLYRVSPLSYQQIVQALESLPPAEVNSIGDLAFQARGPHDLPVRESQVGFQLIFDLCLDNGAFRDLHRHRNCVQIIKDFGSGYGYDLPQPLEEAGQGDAYRALMERAGELADKLDDYQRGLGQYALPLAFRRRALFKMDWAELAYIAEVRTRPSGHFSYRQIAYDMFDAFRQQHPEMAKHIRVTDPAEEGFFER